MKATPDRVALAAAGLLAYAAGALVVLNVTAKQIANMRDDLADPLHRARDQSRGFFEIARASESLDAMVRTLRETRRS